MLIINLNARLRVGKNALQNIDYFHVLFFWGWGGLEAWKSILEPQYLFTSFVVTLMSAYLLLDLE